MKARSQLSASEASALREALGRRLERVGIQTQPEVAIKILDLTSNPDAQLKDYADVVKTDPSLSGRLLKLANSAVFAQRRAVTTIDRACLILGIERLRSISLGFHLSRAAAGDKSAAMARALWGQSLLRAFLAAELARAYVPAHASEAFVIGLMMDAGIPLMPRLIGQGYEKLYKEAGAPGRLYRAEVESLPVTHVDVIAAVAALWKLPELLARPLELHHAPPGTTERPEPVHRLHRVAYTVGLIDLSSPGAGGMPTASTETPGIGTAQRLLGVSAADLPRTIARAMGEYQATTDLFRELADPLAVDDTLMERVQAGMIDALDRAVEESLRCANPGAATGLTIGTSLVEVEMGSDGLMSAYLCDSQGKRLLSHRFVPGRETGARLAVALGVVPRSPAELQAMDDLLKKLAA